MKKFAMLFVAMLFAAIGFGQNLTVGEYAVGKTEISDLPQTALTQALEILEKFKDVDRIAIEGRFDSIRVAKSGKLNEVFNPLFGDGRSRSWVRQLRTMGFATSQIVVLPSQPGAREVAFYVSMKDSAKPEVRTVVVADTTTINALKKEVDSLKNRKPELEKSNKLFQFNHMSLGVGYGIIARDGTHTPHGINVYLLIPTIIGMKLELGWMGAGAYVGEGGHTLYAFANIPILGNDTTGLDIAVGGGVTSFLLPDGRSKLSPDRNVLIGGPGAGLKWHTPVLGDVPLAVSMIGQWSPKIEYAPEGFRTKENSTFSMFVKVALEF